MLTQNNIQVDKIEEKELEDCAAETTDYILPSWLYELLKWLGLLALPTLAWGYQAIASVWGLPFESEIPFTLNIVGTVVAVLIGASSIKNLTSGGKTF